MTPLADAVAINANLDSLTTVFGKILDWFISMVNTIAASPLLLVGVGIFVAGAVIGLARRLING